jgi:hypothetical protein
MDNALHAELQLMGWAYNWQGICISVLILCAIGAAEQRVFPSFDFEDGDLAEKAFSAMVRFTPYYSTHSTLIRFVCQTLVYRRHSPHHAISPDWHTRGHELLINTWKSTGRSWIVQNTDPITS